ncbi:MAG: hypothetical protein OXI17_13990 [Gammaproteobacteria bacterium]|nr:hypothetical protein [Gammaproteobacteria bacterium]MXY90806.1 hypothetical protein [Gammaproteobacteria bacterium]MXZ32304.1 hypothetical protein [Gammaproteobacteria bacterium]MYA36784.1 hypothetical protein [Gammaproteobacteria bacterium]MYC59448.1 hypothetical protein [Gammaproteobacteria bacterium]
MKRRQAETMNLEEFTHLLDVRGCERAAWPAREREHAEVLLRESAEARDLLQSQQRMEGLLDRIEAPEFAGLEARVMRQPLPARTRALADRIVDWLTPGNTPLAWWRPAFAACLPVAFGIALSGWFSFGVDAQDPGYAYWDQELYLLSLYEYADSEIGTETGNE